MKKGIIVLLITVLAAGMVFADFSGSASINFGYNLDGKGWGFTNKKTFDQYSFTFVLDSQVATVGEEHQTDIWAELAGEAYAVALMDYDAYDEVLFHDWDFDITTANIHVYDFTIGILGPKAAFNYANSWTNDWDEDYGTPNYNFANNSNKHSVVMKYPFAHSAGGFNVSYDGYTVSLAIKNAYTAAKEATPESLSDELVWISTEDYNKLDSETQAQFVKVADTTSPAGAYYAVKTKAKDSTSATTALTAFANAESKAFELADGMTLQVAANFLMVKDAETLVGGALKYAYEADKLAASLATDFQFDAKNKVAAIDANINAKYDIVSAKIYFGSDKLGKEDAKYIVEAKLSAEIPVGENSKITVSAEADDLDLAKKADAFKAAIYKASVKAAIDKLTVSASLAYNTVIDKNSTTKAKVEDGVLVSANVEYKADMFTVKAGASVGFEKADKLSYYGLKPSASISTSTLVENCTLSLGWSGADFVAEDATNIGTASKGSINASAKISF